MSEAYTYKCPNCGAYLEYDPTKGAMKCPYCGANAPRPEELNPQAADPADSTGHAAESSTGADGLRSYHCKNCGAEIVTGETTAATRCYFCHSPVVLTDRLSSEFRPDKVIPFKLNREEALAKFKEFLAKHRYVDERFFSDDQMADFSGVYYPYWQGSFTGTADFSGEGTRVSRRDTPREIITITRHFAVKRRGILSFPGILRRGLKAADALLCDRIRPYSFEEAVNFNTAYLSGFLAERYDIPEKEAEASMMTDVEETAPKMMLQHTTYDTLNGKTDFRVTDKKMEYTLLPAWILTYQGGPDGVPYYFMMNGQTGKVSGRLPVSRKKLIITSAIVGVIVAGILCLGGAFVW